MAERTNIPIVPENEARASMGQTRERRLSLELRLRRFGFAFFEGGSLLDWGVREYSAAEIAALKVRALLTLYSPAAVITREPRRTNSEMTTAATETMNSIRRELKRRSVMFVILNRGSIREVFATCQCNNKQEIAMFVVDLFPVLKRILPRPRRPWTPEPHATVIFDAVATYSVSSGIVR